MYRASPIALARALSLFGLVCGSLFAQPTLRISSPADGTVVHAGESLKVTVEVSPSAAFTELVLIAGNPIGTFPKAGDPLYVFVVPIPEKIRPGHYSLAVMGNPRPDLHLDVNQRFSKPITLVVERADEPVRLEVFPQNLSLEPGSKGYLSVKGVFADSQKVELKASTKTIYTSDTPRVVTVHRQGVVTALAPGSAKITVSNGNAKVEIPVVVAAPKGQRLENRETRDSTRKHQFTPSNLPSPSQKWVGLN